MGFTDAMLGAKLGRGRLCQVGFACEKPKMWRQMGLSLALDVAAAGAGIAVAFGGLFLSINLIPTTLSPSLTTLVEH